MVFAEEVVSSWAEAFAMCAVSIAELKQLPLAEKLQIIEAIWEDLRAQAERVPVPQWHRDLLDERRKGVAEGREEILDWDSIKDSLPSHRKA
ncbi:MAG TPA: addiction module protein [Verrucomicrobiae bacterium]